MSNAPTASPVITAATILTPKPTTTPRINGPRVFGVRPGSPFLYSIPVTGERPVTFSVDGLPEGLRLDAAFGRITGVLKSAGEHTLTLRAKNMHGSAEKLFRIVVGEEIALTPAMGWNSYNCFGSTITQDKIIRAALAMTSLGLDQHGWTYVNMDDGWQGARSGPLNALQADPRVYTDMKSLVDEIHALGLKAGIYSSPWTLTYAGRPGGSAENPEGAPDPSVDRKAPKNRRVMPYAIGKYSFAKPDAQQFARWGFDYLKYDWGPVEAPETREMSEALRATGRDIVFSLSNNHVKNLFPLIGEVSKWAQSWRTTTDIADNWGRISNDIGFNQGPWAPYGRPGHYNDADMLVVGQVGGWANKLHPTKLTPDEQYTHLSLWCLLSSPLLIGCDLEKMDDFTLGLLTNDEVLEIDQDTLCKPATQIAGEGDLKVYAKGLDDGSWAVGLFNTGKDAAVVTVNWADLKLTGERRVRDLWRQRDLGVFAEKFASTVASHGVMLVRLYPRPLRLKLGITTPMNRSILRHRFISAVAAILFSLSPPTAHAADPVTPPTTLPSDSNYKTHYPWNKECEDRVAAMKGKPCDLIFIGDSITQNFVETPTPRWGSVGRSVWDKYYANRNALDFGVGADGTQNVLWRLEHMDIKEFDPKVAVILIGVNNSKNSPDEIVAGVKAVVEKTRQIFARAKIILVSILPTARATATMAEANKGIQLLSDNKSVFYLDLAAKMTPVGNTWKGLGPDRLHLVPEGYEIWASEMEPLLGKLLAANP